MSRISLLSLALLASLLIPRSLAAADVDPAKLVGKWENKNPAITQVWNFTKDGTFTISIKSEFLNREESGTYTLEKNVVSLKATKSSDKKREGKSIKMTVMRVTDEKLEIAEDPEDKTTVATFKRVKEAK